MRIPLKLKIFESGRTQRELSLCARVAETRISAIVRGRAEPTADEREAIARVLNCSVAEIFESADLKA